LWMYLYCEIQRSKQYVTNDMYTMYIRFPYWMQLGVYLESLVHILEYKMKTHREGYTNHPGLINEAKIVITSLRKYILTMGITRSSLKRITPDCFCLFVGYDSEYRASIFSVKVFQNYVSLSSKYIFFKYEISQAHLFTMWYATWWVQPYGRDAEEFYLFDTLLEIKVLWKNPKRFSHNTYNKPLKVFKNPKGFFIKGFS
jgi:hypothetical protein